jgi:hypothetical protein
MWKKRSTHNWKQSTASAFVWINRKKKLKNKLNQAKLCPGQDFNPVPPAKEAWLSLTTQRFRNTYIWRL